MQRETHQYDNVIFLDTRSAKPNRIKKEIDRESILTYVGWICASFFIGRVVILDELAPFGVALYASLICNKSHPLVYLIAISAGILTSSFNLRGTQYVGALFILYVYGQAIDSRNKKLSRYKRGLMALISTLIVSTINLYFKGFTIYGLIIAILESIVAFVMVYIFSHTIEVLSRGQKRRILSNEEIICISIFISLVIVGFWDNKRLPISLRNILAIYVILLSAYLGGAGVGASIGITVGFVLSLAGISDAIFIGCLGMCGLMAGTFKDLGRMTSVIAFIIANALTTFYINKSTEIIIPHRDIIGGSLLLLITPNYIIEYMRQFFDASITRNKDQIFYIRRMQDMITGRLKEFSRVFNQLSKTFSKISDGTSYQDGPQEVSKIINAIVDEVCLECSLYRRCWEVEFYRTYNSVFELLTSIERREELNSEPLEQFKKRCPRFNSMLEETNRIYSIFKANLRWERQLDECRYLVADQLWGISQVIDGLAAEIDIDVHFKREVEDKIRIELDKKGIRCKDVLVIEKTAGKLEVAITKKACRGRKECSKVVEGTVSKILGRSLACKDRECLYAGHNECSIYLEESKKFNIMTGVACKTKEFKDTTGDSHTFMGLRGGKFMLALSDGMGSGSRAAAESKDVVSLLENFMEAGFDLDITVKTINSVLIMRSEDEIFATADICLVDQVTGYANFAKIGAVSTFIKKQNTVNVIRASSLPIGIIEDIEMDREEIRLQDDDMIIMVTDGILDAYEGSFDADDWLSGIIAMKDTKNPQEMAEHILDRALKAGHGRAKDDMTVMVSRVWRPAK